MPFKRQLSYWELFGGGQPPPNNIEGEYVEYIANIKHVRVGSGLYIRLIKPDGKTEYLMPRGGDPTVYLQQGFTFAPDPDLQNEFVRQVEAGMFEETETDIDKPKRGRPRKEA